MMKIRRCILPVEVTIKLGCAKNKAGVVPGGDEWHAVLARVLLNFKRKIGYPSRFITVSPHMCALRTRLPVPSKKTHLPAAETHGNKK